MNASSPLRNHLRSFALIVVTLVAGLVTTAVADTGPESGGALTVEDYPVAPGGETRPTLDPSRFNENVAAAYAVAKRIPEVLDAQYCYCDCALNFGHKSNLSCFVDNHASNCGICMAQAFEAYHHHKAGLSTDAIKAKVDARFGRKLDQYGAEARARLRELHAARINRSEDPKP